MTQVMLYQPKEQPIVFLKELEELFSQIPAINHAYYSKASYIENGEILEKYVIAIEVKGNKENFVDIKDVVKFKSKYKEDVIFVYIDEPPFNKYFSMASPFYKQKG